MAADPQIRHARLVVIALAGQQGMLHWNGTAWSQMIGGGPNAGPQCNGVWGSSSTDVWFVCAGASILFHFDGTALTKQSGLPTTTDLYGVSGSGPNDVWVVGKQGTIMHFDGTAWSLSQDGTGAPLHSVYAADPNDAWLLAAGLIHRWNGAAWSPVNNVGNDSLGVIWGTAANDVWAFGATAFHWDGSSWTSSTIGNYSVSAVWGTATNDVWATGQSNPDAFNVIHWDGATWSPVPTDPIPLQMRGMWESSSGDVWVVGGFETILHRQQGRP